MRSVNRLMAVAIAAGMWATAGAAETSGNTSAVCAAGRAGNFPCMSVDLMGMVDLKGSGLRAASGNDVWGWTDPVTGREYAIMGLSSKTAFVDVTDPRNPVHVGDLPTHTSDSIWRDIKVYRNHAFIVSEAWNHGMQVFDLTQLRNIRASAVTFVETAYYGEFGSAHNIVINEDTGYAYAVGSNTCDAGMHVVDIREPLQPRFVTCVDRSIFDDVDRGDGGHGDHSLAVLHGEDYTHDAQCVVYQGPDHRFHGREVCVASNADTVNIVDVTDKSAPSQLSVVGYEGLGYTHQGWLTEDHKYFLLGDELDEQRHGVNTKTLIFDVTDLANPRHIGTYVAQTRAIDHNMYVKGNYVYQANYEAGLRILDLTDVASGVLREVGYFDTVPDSDRAQFQGAWSVFPYFESGTVVISNIDGTLHVVRPQK